MAWVYILVAPLAAVALAVLYNFIWYAIHEYSHVAALKLSLGKHLQSYKVRLYPHDLYGEWVPASVTWNTTRDLTAREVARIAIAPLVVEFFAGIGFMGSCVFLSDAFVHSYFLFFLWATFCFAGMNNAMASLVCTSATSDLYVFSRATGHPIWEIKAYGWFFIALSALLGFFFIAVTI